MPSKFEGFKFTVILLLSWIGIELYLIISMIELIGAAMEVK